MLPRCCHLRERAPSTTGLSGAQTGSDDVAAPTSREADDILTLPPRSSYRHRTASSCLGGAGVWGLPRSYSFMTGSQKVRPGGAAGPVLPFLWGFSLSSCTPRRRCFLAGLGEARPGPEDEEGAAEKRTEHGRCTACPAGPVPAAWPPPAPGGTG